MPSPRKSKADIERELGRLEGRLHALQQQHDILQKQYTVKERVLSLQENETKSAKETVEKLKKELHELGGEYAALEKKHQGMLNNKRQELRAVSPKRFTQGLIIGSFIGSFIVSASIVAYNTGLLDRPLERSLEHRKPTITVEQAGKIASKLTFDGIINTPEELYEFLEIPPSDSPREEMFKAYLSAFQEKCNYALDMEVPITGKPNAETYMAATVIKQSPELQEKIRIKEYAYFNQLRDGYNARIPHLALVKVKERLRDTRSIRSALDAHDQTLVRIVGELTEGIREPQQKAERLLRFTQSIIYNYDVDSDDFPKHPLEMIADGGGDCEDGAILYASLMKAAGFDSAVAVFDKPRHAMAAVVSVQGNWGLEHQGKRYTLAETRGDFPLGDVPKEYRKANYSLFVTE